MRILGAGVIAAFGLLLPIDAVHAHREVVTVPDVLNLSVRQARDRIARAGLAVRLVGDAKGRGHLVVTGQHPAAGRKVARNALVRITARRIKGATPPRKRQYIRCPNVVGLRAHEARNRLERAGLGWTFVSWNGSARGPRYVASQSPSAGTSVRKGARVRLTLRAPKR